MYYLYMKTYHYIFMTAKMIIVSLFIIGKLNLFTNTHHLESIMEDLFSVYVAIMIIYIFWPWSERKIDKHDKMFVLSAGILLLLTKNYEEVFRHTKEFYFMLSTPLRSVHLL